VRVKYFTDLKRISVHTLIEGTASEQREPHHEAAVSLRKMVTFVTWPSSRTEFLVLKMFCKMFCLFELVFVRLKDDRRRGEFVAFFAKYKNVCTK